MKENKLQEISFVTFILRSIRKIKKPSCQEAALVYFQGTVKEQSSNIKSVLMI